MLDLKRCLNPVSIAVVGGKEAERVIQQCQKMGFAGQLWAVNPRRDALSGLDCYKQVEDLPAAPDVAFVAVPAEPTIDLVRRLSAMNAGGVICYASGFREVGAAERHTSLLDAAGQMPVIGPNCYGYINAMSGAALWPDQHGVAACESGVAIFSASGNVSINLTMQQRGLPLALIVTVGNQAMVGIEQGVEAVLEDDRIRAIGLHIEGLQDLELFTRLAGRAAELRKPVVVLKAGKSTAGARITLSHTATLAGESALYDAYFRRLGVAQVGDLESFLETLKLLAVCGPLAGTRIASMSCSGGEASLIADLAEPTGISFPPLKPQHQEMVRQTLNEYVNVDNPLDYHTFIWGDSNRMRTTFSAMLAGHFDLTLLILDYPCSNDCDYSEWVQAGEAFADACEAAGQPGAILCTLAENMPRQARDALAARGVPTLLGMPQALAAIEAAGSVCRLSSPLPQPYPLPDDDGEPLALSEFESKKLLRAAGLRITDGALVNTVMDAVLAAEHIGFPVAIKASAEGLSHKTEKNAVRLGIKNREQVQQAATELFALGDQLLVEKMVEEGVVELLLGASSDPQFGHYLTIGLGGIFVELFRDRQILLLPVSDEQIRDALMALQSAPLLCGFRGRPAADIDAVIESVQRLAHYAVLYKNQLREIDINPLIVGAKGRGATVVDALIVNFGAVNTSAPQRAAEIS